MPDTNEQKTAIFEGEFRAYVFSMREVLKGTKDLLRAAGYSMQSPVPAGLVKPSFRARRTWAGRQNEIFAVARPELSIAVDGLVYLSAARSILGSSVEYVLLLPPINEYLLIEFLADSDYLVQREMDRNRISLWMCNPAEEALVSFVGLSCDPVFRQSPAMPGMVSMDMIRRMKEREAKRGTQTS